jgi:aspartyl-tRNA(Asn)/glutamyl-tRNA(Gln) amidotransferase subunit C
LDNNASPWGFTLDFGHFHWARSKSFERPKRPSYSLLPIAMTQPALVPSSTLLTATDIARVANLARLELRPDETERVLGQLNGFFSLVAQMDAVNTDGVEPLAHPAAILGDVALRLRDDIANEPNQRDASQRSAPAVERGLFLVPKVIE